MLNMLPGLALLPLVVAGASYNLQGPPAFHFAGPQVAVNLTTQAFPNASDATRPADVRAALVEALAEWQEATGVIFTLADTPARIPQSGDGQNLVTWMSYAEGGVPPGATPNATARCSVSGSTGVVRDCDIVIWNEPATSLDFTTHEEDVGLVDLKQTFLHEWGHAVGLNHSSLGHAMLWPYTKVVGWGSWHPDYAHLTSDELAAAVVAYPNARLAEGTGAIGGRVLKSGAPVFGARVIAHRSADGIVFASTLTHGPAQPAENGRYLIEGLPPGTYWLAAQPNAGPQLGQGNFSGTGWTNSPAFTSDWQTTVLGQVDAPTPIVVTAGAVTAAPDLPVTTGADRTSPLWIWREGEGSVWGGSVPIHPGESVTIWMDCPGIESVDAWSVSDPSIVVGTPIVEDNIGLPLTIPAGARGGMRSIVARVGARLEFFTAMLQVPEEFDCDNFLDDDGDGDTDCEDIDCIDRVDSPCEGGGDTDGDGIIDALDNCPFVRNANQADGDADGVGTLCDTCPFVWDPAQADGNGDGIGDLCSSIVWVDVAPAAAPDGLVDVGDVIRMLRFAVVTETPTPSELYRANVSPSADFGGDPALRVPTLEPPWLVDVADVVLALRIAVNLTRMPVGTADSDGDGVSDARDNCPSVQNPGQQDLDGDGVGDGCF